MKIRQGREQKPEVTPLIMLRDIDIKGSPIPEGMNKMFVSYSVLNLATGQFGFGNTVTVYQKEAYANVNIERFIADLQKSISMAIKAKTGQDVMTQVLFFR